jgi:O-antigen ligase
MTSGSSLERVFWPVALWIALLSGVCVAWSPRYWAVSVALTAVASVAAGWSLFRAVTRGFQPGGMRLPWQSAVVALIAIWGFAQIWLKITVAPQLTLYSGIVWAMSAVAFVLGAEILGNRAARTLFLELMMWSLTVLAVIAMVQFFDHADVFGLFEAPDSVMGTFISRNQFAALMEMAAPIAFWYMLERSFWMGGFCCVMIVAATITAASRAGFFLMCVELAVFIVIVMIQRRRQAKAIVLTFAGLALLVAMAAAIAGTDELQRRFADSDPYVVRRELLASTKKLIAERPWAGHGMGTWSAIYPHVATFDAALLANEAHNDWAQWAAEGGIVFDVLMAVLVLSIAVPAVRSIWGIGLLSVMAHSYVDFPIREPILSFMWFALAGAAACYVGKTPGRHRQRDDVREQVQGVSVENR